MLPDDVLLEIFNSHGYHERYNDAVGDQREKAWQTLVHVCRRWRRIVFGFPRHLNLQLVCTTTTQARDMLDVWPALPIIVSYSDHPTRNVDNIFAALAECRDRVCQIFSSILRHLEWDIYWAIQQPFPELRYMTLVSANERMGVLPDSFLGGSAPRLEYLFLLGVPFPGLPKLLLSATHLVTLRLSNIPHSGYISPDAMVVALSTLTSLDALAIKFESPRSCPDLESRRPPPSTRSVLPVLTYFEFQGVSEYLDDLVACIDAPQLNKLHIMFFDAIVFDTPQLVRFISHTPKSNAFQKAYITLENCVSVGFSSQTSRYGEFTVTILCKGLDWQVSCLGHVCTSCLPPLSVLELYFYMDFNPDWTGRIENRQWLELFRSFTAVKNLYVSEKLASHIVPALQELVEGRTTDVLPALQNIFLKGFDSSGSVQDSIRQLVAARQAINHPIGISPWTDSEEDEDWGDW